MGLLLQKIGEYQKEMRVAGSFTSDMLEKWFGKEKAIKRTCGLDTVVFEPKSAVIIVGVSGIGKTRYAEEFLKKHSEFELCSYDESFYQAMEEKQTDSQIADKEMGRILEKKIRNANRHEKSIVLDGLFVDVVFRGAILNTLKTLGYKTHLVYFTWEYVEKNIEENALKRSIELCLYKQYLEDKNITDTKQALEVRKDILNICSRESGMMVDELLKLHQSDFNVMQMVNYLMFALGKEVESFSVIEQEKFDLYSYGSNYYYEII